jgi:hypothetical protein
MFFLRCGAGRDARFLVSTIGGLTDEEWERLPQDRLVAAAGGIRVAVSDPIEG